MDTGPEIHYADAGGQTTPTNAGFTNNRWQRSRHRRVAVFVCCRQFVAFLFSQLGLASTVVAYSILGGVIFSAIESPNEADVRQKLNAYRLDRVAEINNLTAIVLLQRLPIANTGDNGDDGQHMERNHTTYFDNEVERILVAFQTRVVKAINEDGWDGRDDTDPDRWSFSSSLLYAVTITTTIGYGHVTPKTSGGRFATIVYAIGGIPLTFLYLSTIGNYLASVFRIFYFRVCCRCVKRCKTATSTMATTLQPSADLTPASGLQPSPSAMRPPIRNQVVNAAATSCRRVSMAVRSKMNANRLPEHATKLPSGLMLPLASIRSASHGDRQADGFTESTVDKRTGSSSSSCRVSLSAFGKCQCCHTPSPVENQPRAPRHHQRRRYSKIAHCAPQRGCCSAVAGLFDGLTTWCVPGDKSTIRAPQSTSMKMSLATEVESNLRFNDQAATNTSVPASVQMRPEYFACVGYGTQQAPEEDPNPNEPIASLELADDRKLGELVGVGTARLVDGAAATCGSSTSTAYLGSVDGLEIKKHVNSSGSLGLALKTCSEKLRSKLQLRSRLVFTAASNASGDSSLSSGSTVNETEAIAQRFGTSEGQYPPGGPGHGDVIRTAIEADAAEISDVTSTSGGRCRTVAWRCTQAASQFGTSLRMKITAERRQRNSARNAASKTDERSPSASWTSSGIGRVRKVGTKAFRWATLVKGRVSRGGTPFQTTRRVDSDRPSISNAANSTVDKSTIASEIKSSSNIFVSCGGIINTSERRIAVGDDVTAAVSSSSVVVHLTRPSMSSDSFVTALDSLEWLPRFKSDPSNDDVMSVDLERDEISIDEKEPRELVVGCALQDNRSSLLKPKEDGRISVEQEDFVVGISINHVPDYPFDRHMAGVPDHSRSDAFRVDEKLIIQDKLIGKFATEQSTRRQFHRTTSESYRNVDVEKQRVPIYRNGSLLFTLWEDWDLLTSFYFCFITLTTIGFGDIVPGTSADDWSSHEKLVLCALWLAVGLSLIAMCFNLVQEEVREKCIRAARRCGLVTPVDDV